MRSYSLSTLAVFLIGIFAILPSAFAEDDTPDQQDAEFILPSWIKLIAGYWYDDVIEDQQFFGTIKYLVSNEIIILPTTDTEPSTSNYIPVWVKNIAGWWASDQIDDQTFVNGLQYLVQIGSIQVQTAVAGASGGGGGGGGGY